MSGGRFPEVAAYVRAKVGAASDAPAFQHLLTRLLGRPGRLLSERGPAKWPAFVLQTCRALGGNAEEAVPVAAAVEFVVAAADVVDDLVDDEWEEGREHWARALNASPALILLAQRCVDDLAKPLGAERALSIGGIIAQGSLAACAGEDFDLRLETTPDASEEAAYEMTRRKSGSIVAFACQAGAAVATAEPKVIELMGVFGGHVGVVAQLLNDIAGITRDTSDLRRKKKTLPIAYALRCGREENLADVLVWFEEGRRPDDEEKRRFATAMHDLGALHYTQVVADTHRREALAVLRTLAQATGREEVRHLRRLVPAVAGGGARRRSPRGKPH